MTRIFSHLTFLDTRCRPLAQRIENWRRLQESWRAMASGRLTDSDGRYRGVFFFNRKSGPFTLPQFDIYTEVAVVLRA